MSAFLESASPNASASWSSEQIALVYRVRYKLLTEVVFVENSAILTLFGILQEMIFAIVMMLLSITVFNYVVGTIGTHVMRCFMRQGNGRVGCTNYF